MHDPSLDALDGRRPGPRSRRGGLSESGPSGTGPRLNADAPLGARLAAALSGARRFDAAVAYAKASGVERLVAAGLPARSRVVVGTGFALTDPEAAEALATAGCDVRVDVGADRRAPSAFHPKLYLVERADELVVLSGSANLTAAGLETNVEQYEELRLAIGSEGAAAHARRFDALWALGDELADLQASGAWNAYGALAAARRERDEGAAADERRVTQEMRDRVRAHRAARGAPPRHDDALAALLGRITGLPVERRGHVHVKVDDPPVRAEGIQRIGLSHDGAGRLVLGLWPGELQTQARAFYGGGRALALLAFLARDGRWSGRPKPHLGFYTASVPQRLYSTPAIGLERYVRQWVDDDLDRVHQYGPDELRDDLWPWMLERGYASPADTAELPRFERDRGRRPTQLRPGIELAAAWPADQDDDRLAREMRAALDDVLAVLEEPPLPRTTQDDPAPHRTDYEGLRRPTSRAREDSQPEADQR